MKSKALEALAKKIAALSDIEGKVGWFEKDKYPDGTQVAYIATIQEFGSPKNSIPPRPFMRPASIENKQKWAETAKTLSKRVAEGKMTAQDAMEGLTSVAEDDVRVTIVNVTSPALSPITIELRSMKKKDPDLKVTGKIVGKAAAKVREDGYVTPSGVSTQPLNDTGYMIDTLTHVVESKP